MNIYLEKIAEQNQHVYETYVQTRGDVEGGIAKKSLKAAETGAMVGAGYHIITNKMPVGLTVDEALKYSRGFKKPVAIGSLVGAGYGLARGLQSDAYSHVKKYNRVKDVDGVADYEKSHTSPYLGEAIGGSVGLFAASKANKHFYPTLYKKLYSRLPVGAQPLAPLAVSAVSAITGSKIGKTIVDGQNRRKADFIRQEYYE